MNWHPLDNPDFRAWLKEQDTEPDFAYGIYDSQWGELYQQYLDDIDPTPDCHACDQENCNCNFD